MKWDDGELSASSSIVEWLEADVGPRETLPCSSDRGLAHTRVIRLRASAAEGLKAGCCGHKSLIVRHLYRALGFDEHRLFRHRLEHKLMQALVLHHYCPDAVPVTRGVWRELEGIAAAGIEPAGIGRAGIERAEIQANLERVCSAEGALIKRALGYGSSERKQVQATADCVRVAAVSGVGSGGGRQCSGQMDDETFVLQERVAIEEEYRVHTVEGRVAPELTHRRYGWGILPDEREAPNAFVQHAIDRLPNGFVRGTIVAWDVAKTDDARFVIIEANLAGYHPVFEPGFQCSGFFQGPWGPALVARLFDFVERTYGVKVDVDVDVPADAIEHDVYWWPARWQDLFRIADDVGSLSDAFDRLHGANGAHGVSGVSGVSGVRGARHRALDDTCPQDRRAFITLLSRLEHVSKALMSLA